MVASAIALPKPVASMVKAVPVKAVRSDVFEGCVLPFTGAAKVASKVSYCASEIPYLAPDTFTGVPYDPDVIRSPLIHPFGLSLIHI